MADLVDRALKPKNLNAAWRYLRKERGLWRRGLPVPVMQDNLLRYVGELTEEVRQGRYCPEPMRCFEIDKADGKKRLICAASVRDKLLQRAFLNVLDPLGERIFHPASFGFRRQCTLDMALARTREHVRRDWVWLGDADIRSCFDRIPQAAVLRSLQRLTGDKAFVRIVQLWLESVPEAYRFEGPGRGLPQGMVLAPFLCNLHLHPMDQALDRRGIPFVRFADDFLTFGRDRAEAGRGLDYANRLLRELGLELHPEKTRVIRSSRRHRFLGKRLPEAKRKPETATAPARA